MSSAAWWADFNQYLRSREWEERRAKVLERDSHTCRAVLPGCLTRATQVHHLSYAHYRFEPLYELISLCRSCHQRITAMDRQRRARVVA